MPRALEVECCLLVAIQQAFAVYSQGTLLGPVWKLQVHEVSTAERRHESQMLVTYNDDFRTDNHGFRKGWDVTSVDR